MITKNSNTTYTLIMACFLSLACMYKLILDRPLLEL